MSCSPQFVGFSADTWFLALPPSGRPQQTQCTGTCQDLVISTFQRGYLDQSSYPLPLRLCLFELLGGQRFCWMLVTGSELSRKTAQSGKYPGACKLLHPQDLMQTRECGKVSVLMPGISTLIILG
ncbi:hypothetical protein ABW21_db0205707 [Orbilia brochopaga]|nr:hypothetical protein ABW21_db0205707 [Drechslerella brochopaga]